MYIIVKSVNLDYYVNPVLHMVMKIWRMYSLEMPVWKLWTIL